MIPHRHAEAKRARNPLLGHRVHQLDNRDVGAKTFNDPPPLTCVDLIADNRQVVDDRRRDPVVYEQGVSAADAGVDRQDAHQTMVSSMK